MEEIIPFLIDDNQSGINQCRQTQDNIRRTPTRLSIYEGKNEVMEKVGFHVKFFQSIKTLYISHGQRAGFRPRKYYSKGYFVQSMP